jgi:hypothetical protein
MGGSFKTTAPENNDFFGTIAFLQMCVPSTWAELVD